MGDHSDWIRRIVDCLHERINEQDICIDQLSSMINKLVGVVEAQKKELEVCKKAINDHC